MAKIVPVGGVYSVRQNVPLAELIQWIDDYKQVLGVRGGMGDWRPELRLIALDLAASFEKNFLRAGRPTWPALSVKGPRVPWRKVNKYDAAHPLLDTGALMRAATATREGVPGSLFHMGHTNLVMGVGGPGFEYAARQQDPRNTARYKPRPFIKIQPQDNDAIQYTLQQGVRKRLLAGGYQYRKR